MNSAMNTLVNAAVYQQQSSFPLPVPEHPVPAMTVIGRGIEFTNRLAPALASRLLWRLWFTPQRVLPNERARVLVASAEETLRIDFEGRPLQVHGWGRGPTVLLVHGWSGYGAQLGSFVQPLVRAGFRVLLFDAPGHAAHPRQEFHLGRYAELLCAIITAAGGVQAVVGHSLGATAAALALQYEERPVAYVGIATSANLKTLLQGFQRKLQLSESSMQRLRNALVDYFGADVWTRYSLDHHFPQLPGPTLLVHDSHDAEAPQTNAVYLKSLRPDAICMMTDGLGHNRILHDAAVVRQVVAFISGRHGLSSQ